MHDNDDFRTTVGIFLIFAVFGSLAKMLRQWDPNEIWQRKVGGLIASLVAGAAMGWPLIERYPESPGLVAICIAGASWGGAEILDLLLRRLKGAISDSEMGD